MTKIKFTLRLKPVNYGFSLIEMAIVLLILGILLSGLLVAVGGSTESTRRVSTREQLNTIAEALYGFAQTSGRLPCPATSTSNGYESPVGGGACSSFHGFVPAASLDLQGAVNGDGLLLDAWSNPLRYSVVSTNFTNQTNLQNYFNANTITTGVTLFRICNENTCSGTINSSTSPAVIVSMGSNWSTFSSANETENSGEATDGAYSIPNDPDFVTTEYNEDNFDDMINWLSPHILFSRMISAGQLP